MEFNGLTQDDLLFGGLPQSFQLPALATTFDPSEDQQHYLSTITGSNLKRKDSNSDESSSPPQVAKKQRTEPVTPTCSTTEDIEPPLQRVPPSQNGLSSFNEMDVLSGRGGGTNVHTGNRNFRDLINLHRRAYLKARKNDKPAISRKIVHMVRKNKGRFLRKDEASGLWFEIGDAAAREKVAQALRQRAPEMRRLLFDSEREETTPPSDQMLQQHINPVRTSTMEHLGLPFQQGGEIPTTFNNGNPLFPMSSNKASVNIPSLPSGPYAQMFSAALLGNGMNCYATNGA